MTKIFVQYFVVRVIYYGDKTYFMGLEIWTVVKIHFELFQARKCQKIQNPSQIVLIYSSVSWIFLPVITSKMRICRSHYTEENSVLFKNRNFIVFTNDHFRITIHPEPLLCVTKIHFYTGRFIMFSVITNIYNKKTKGPTLMELFTATGKLKNIFWQLQMFDVCTTGDIAHIDTILKFLPHTRQHGCL
jgi:hypothetical protein